MTEDRGAHASLEESMRGPVILPGDSDYEEARKVYNGMIDRRPALIAQCRDSGDVIAAISHARDQDLPISIRGGGHHANGFGVWDDALVVDLRQMHGVDVDPSTHTVRVQGGPWGDVDHATHAFGMAIPRNHFDNRRCWPDARWRGRKPGSAVSAHDRQPHRC